MTILLAHLRHFVSAAALVGIGTTSFASSSFAQSAPPPPMAATPPPVAAAPPPVVAAPPQVVAAPQRPRYEYETGPDVSLLRNGLWTLSVMYTTSVVVAVVSPLPADDYLYIPVAGPWLDLSHRDEQDNDGGEILNKALIVADGVIQALGAANIVLSFIFPETRLVEQVKRPTRQGLAFETRPIVLPSLVGVSAQGTF